MKKRPILSVSMLSLCLLLAVILHVPCEAPAEGTPLSPEGLRQYLEVLTVGRLLIEKHDVEFKNGPSSYYAGEIERLAEEIDASSTHETLASLSAEIERLDRELVMESVRFLPICTFSTRRLDLRSIWRNIPKEERPRYSEYVREHIEAYRAELRCQVYDWRRNVRGLARHGIDLDLSVESDRILFEPPDVFARGVPDRLYDQKTEFFRAIANERQRMAAELIRMEMKLNAWSGIVKQRRAMGAKLSGAEVSVSNAAEALRGFRKAVVERSYAVQVEAEKKAFDAIEKLKLAATAGDSGVPVIWPGASLYSTGRFSLEPAWQGLLNYDINHLGLYRDAEGFTIDANNYKTPWSFSFTPPGVSKFSVETLEGSWVHSSRRYHYPEKSSSNAVSQDVVWSVLAPGTLVNTPGPAMALSNTTLENPLPPDRVAMVIDGKPTLVSRGDPINPADLTENWAILYSEMGVPQFPVLVVFENRPDEMIWTDEALEVRRKDGVGRCVVALPFGAVAQPIDESKEWKDIPERVLKQVHRILPLLTYYPITTEETFSVGDKSVQVWSRVTESVKLESEFCKPGKPYVPLPVLLGMSICADLGLKVDSPLTDWLMMTKYGPYQATYDSVLTYHVPKTRMWDRLELRPTQGEQEWLDICNDPHRIASSSGDFSRFTQIATIAPAYLMLSKENREKLRYYRNPLELDSGMAAREPLRVYYQWDPPTTQINVLIDPVTAQYYWLRGWRRGRYGTAMRGDMPNRQSHQMAGCYIYARFFGEWEMLARNWEYFRRFYSTVRARQCWAVPAHSCMSTGFVFATDMLGDGWRCHHLMNSVARILGHVEEQRMAEYLGSLGLMSVATLGHPLMVPYAQLVSNTGSGPGREARCYARDAKIAVFGPPTDRCDVGCTHNLYSLSGCNVFDYPMYGGLFALYPTVGRYQHDAFARVYTRWLSEDFVNDAGGQIGTVNYLKYCSWIGMEKETAREYWHRFLSYPLMKEAGSSWCRMNILNGLPILIGQENDMWLAYWDTARLEDGTYDRNNRVARISLAASRPGVLEAMSSLAPRTVEINGTPMPSENYSYDSETQELLIPFESGSQAIVVYLDNTVAPDNPPGVLDVPNDPKVIPVDREAPRPGILAVPILTGNIRVGQTEPVDIRPYVNMGWSDERAGDGKGGTIDNGQSWAFPHGETAVRGVPFDLIDPSGNNGKSCIVLGGKAVPHFPEEVASIKVGKRVKRIFFFHACEGDTSDSVVMKYRLNFRSGQTRELDVTMGKDIAGWRIPPGGIQNNPLIDADLKAKNWYKQLGTAIPEQVVLTDRLPDLSNARGSRVWPPVPASKAELWGLGVGGYVYSWTNAGDVLDTVAGGIAEFQKGLDILESMDIVSAGAAIPMVFAVTVELAE